jgi:BirA family biotin operon repressor/biotin-[acetyl-CoA-carboxylase] ligase
MGSPRTPPTPRNPGIPLSETALRQVVLANGSLWSALTVVPQTGSTNADLLAAAGDGAAEGTVLVAERQTDGRGRQGRTWVSEPGASLTFSVLLRPAAVPQARRAWLPLLTGIALARAVRAGTGVDVTLKWPNDALAGEAKLAGILAEQAGDAVVVGVGINVSTSAGELPATTGLSLPPTSLALSGASSTDRADLLAGLLRELGNWYLAWTAAAGDAEASGLHAEYLRWCSTVGRDVRVHLPGGSQVAGAASGIDPAGRLVVTTATGPVPVSAGDVVHVR